MPTPQYYSGLWIVWLRVSVFVISLFKKIWSKLNLFCPLNCTEFKHVCFITLLKGYLKMLDARQWFKVCGPVTLSSILRMEALQSAPTRLNYSVNALRWPLQLITPQFIYSVSYPCGLASHAYGYHFAPSVPPAQQLLFTQQL